VIAEMEKDTLLEGEIDGSGALMTTAQVIFKNFFEGYTSESISVASDFDLERNRHREAQIP
jgi:hypothetical protein